MCELEQTSDRGDGDGCPGPTEDPPHPLLHPSLPLLRPQCGQALPDHKHVVDPNPQQKERQHGVGWPVEEAQGRAEAVADGHPHHHTHHPAQAQEEPLVDKAAAPQHEADIEEDNHVTDHQKTGVLEHLVLQGFKEHAETSRL